MLLTLFTGTSLADPLSPDKIIKTSQITTSTEEVEIASLGQGVAEAQVSEKAGSKLLDPTAGHCFFPESFLIPQWCHCGARKHHFATLLSSHKAQYFSSTDSILLISRLSCGRKPERDVLSSDTKLHLFFERQMFSADNGMTFFFFLTKVRKRRKRRRRKYTCMYGALSSVLSELNRFNDQSSDEFHLSCLLLTDQII